MRTVRVVAALVEENGQYLITQRRPTAVLPNLWEFPGGRVEVGESDAQALQREMVERLGVQVQVSELISYVSHPYDKYTVHLYLYACTVVEGKLTCEQVQNFCWAGSAEFDNYEFTPADEESMSALLGESGGR